MQSLRGTLSANVIRKVCKHKCFPSWDFNRGFFSSSSGLQDLRSFEPPELQWLSYFSDSHWRSEKLRQSERKTNKWARRKWGNLQVPKSGDQKDLPAKNGERRKGEMGNGVKTKEKNAPCWEEKEKEDEERKAARGARDGGFIGVGLSG